MVRFSALLLQLGQGVAHLTMASFRTTRSIRTSNEAPLSILGYSSKCHEKTNESVPALALVIAMLNAYLCIHYSSTALRQRNRGPKVSLILRRKLVENQKARSREALTLHRRVACFGKAVTAHNLHSSLNSCHHEDRRFCHPYR